MEFPIHQACFHSTPLAETDTPARWIGKFIRSIQIRCMLVKRRSSRNCQHITFYGFAWNSRSIRSPHGGSDNPAWRIGNSIRSHKIRYQAATITQIIPILNIFLLASSENGAAKFKKTKSNASTCHVRSSKVFYQYPLLTLSPKRTMLLAPSCLLQWLCQCSPTKNDEDK